MVECAYAQNFVDFLLEEEAPSAGKISLASTSSPLLRGTVRFRHSVSCMSIGGSRTV